jgi:hypothetical protein
MMHRRSKSAAVEHGHSKHAVQLSVSVFTLHYITYSTQQGVGTPLGANVRLVGGGTLEENIIIIIIIIVINNILRKRRNLHTSHSSSTRNY